MVGKNDKLEKNRSNHQNNTESNDYFNARVSRVVELNHVFVACGIFPSFSMNKANLIIIVDTGTTQKDIKDDWEQIIKIRDKVAHWNGEVKVRKLSISQTAFRLKYEFNMSYREIAMFFNFEIVFVLCQGLGLINDPMEREYNEIIEEFNEYFAYLGYSIDDAKEFAEDAKERLEKASFPWTLGTGPFTATKVREQIREFKRKINNSGITLHKKYDFIFGYMFNSDDREKIYSLYKKTYRINNSDQKLLEKFSRVYSLIYKSIMNSDGIKELSEFPEVGKINSFFP